MQQGESGEHCRGVGSFLPPRRTRTFPESYPCEAETTSPEPPDWNAVPFPESFGPRARRDLLDWLQHRVAAGARLLSAPPGSRWFWWPEGVPTGTRRAIVSSRLPRPVEQCPEWCAALRSAVESWPADQTLLLVGRRTTTELLLRRCAERLRYRTLVIEPPRRRESLAGFWRRVRKESDLGGSLPGHRVLASPLVATEPLCSSTSHPQRLADQWVLGWADELLALYIRPGGQIERLLQGRLEDRTSNLLGEQHSCRISVAATLNPARQVADWQARGAALWSAPVSASRLSAGGSLSLERRPCSERRTDAPIRAWSTWLERESQAEAYLLHCTRAPRGPWPGEREQDYLDALLEGRLVVTRTARSSLVRIVEEQLIRASAAGIRGGYPVVCWTAVSLSHLASLRVFQPQRQRWEFEPYGVAVRQEWLAQQGTRPVLYGDRDDWLELTETDRPWFQVRHTRGGRRPQDWTRQREWRTPGDVSLQQVPADQAFVFVPTREDAVILSAVSRWPVQCLRDERP